MVLVFVNKKKESLYTTYFFFSALEEFYSLNPGPLYNNSYRKDVLVFCKHFKRY